MTAEICAYIVAGAFPQVAAEAAGIPARTFLEWMGRGDPTTARDEKGRRGRPHPLFTPFWQAVRQAQAQARLRAEMAALEADPIQWLKSGPGKDREEMTGWSTPVRQTTVNINDNRQVNLFATAVGQKLMMAILGALTPWPEARAAVAEAIRDAEERPLRRAKEVKAIEVHDDNGHGRGGKTAGSGQENSIPDDPEGTVTAAPSAESAGTEPV